MTDEESKVTCLKTTGEERKEENGEGYDDTDLYDLKPGDCGIGMFKPKFLQRFKTVGSFSVTYGIASIVVSALGQYLNSQITTLEKHFNFNSSVSGLLLACNDFGYFITCLGISYITRRVNIPRFLALACVIYGISGLMCVVPYFGTADKLSVSHFTHMETYNSSQEVQSKSTSQLCVNTNNSQAMKVDNMDDVTNNKDSIISDGFHDISPYWRHVAMLVIGLGTCIQGISKSPRVSFVPVYIDDNTPGYGAAFYIGITTGFGIFGPALAFVIGGAFSKMYITLEDTNISRKDPRWLGAWWLGFLVFGILALILAIPLLFFPRRMIIKPEVRRAELKKKQQLKDKNRIKAEVKGFVSELFSILKTPCFSCVTLGVALQMMAVAGFFGFQPKFLESYFGFPAWKVNMIIGTTSMLGASMGSVIGGTIISRFKLSPLQSLKMMIVVCVTGICLTCIVYFIECEPPNISMGSVENSSQCVSNCACNDKAFYPVCGKDGINYFSPCHAGCHDAIEGGKTFTNCTCTSIKGMSQVTGGLCDRGCESKFYLYVGLTFANGLILSNTVATQFMVLTRSVKESQKPMALGIAAFAGSLIGWFPGPILFGNIIDSTCLISRPSSGGQGGGGSRKGGGVCLLYDLVDFRNKYHGAIIGLRSLSCAFYFLTLIIALVSKKTAFYDHGRNDTQDKQGEEDLNIKLQAVLGGDDMQTSAPV